MARVQRIDGSMVTIPGSHITNIRQVGDEGSRSATALVDGQDIPVYNSIVDGFDTTWYEQIAPKKDISFRGRLERIEE